MINRKAPLRVLFLLDYAFAKAYIKNLLSKLMTLLLTAHDAIAHEFTLLLLTGLLLFKSA